jgi:hypothetical protein
MKNTLLLEGVLDYLNFWLCLSFSIHQSKRNLMNFLRNWSLPRTLRSSGCRSRTALWIIYVKFHRTDTHNFTQNRLINTI